MRIDPLPCSSCAASGAAAAPPASGAPRGPPAEPRTCSSSKREMAERWPRDGREMAERWPRDSREMAERWPRDSVPPHRRVEEDDSARAPVQLSRLGHGRAGSPPPHTHTRGGGARARAAPRISTPRQTGDPQHSKCSPQRHPAGRTSAAPRLYLGCISRPVSRLAHAPWLACPSSPASRRHLGDTSRRHISATSRLAHALDHHDRAARPLARVTIPPLLL